MKNTYLTQVVKLISIVGIFCGNILPAQASNEYGALLALGNLTFYKNFSKYQSTINADYSAGTATGTVTATRSSSSPGATYDSSGTLTLNTTSSVARWTQGFYATSGFIFRPGIFIEGAATNRVLYSDDYTQANWVKVNATADSDSVSTPYGTKATVTLTATASNATILQAFVLTSATRTYSVFLKRKTGSGTINISDDGVTWSAVTVDSSWRRYQVSGSSGVNPSCGIQIVTSGDAIYSLLSQYEDNPYATSPIPTTSSSLTRNAETLTYPISSNRTADTETITLKLTPLGTGTDYTSNGNISTTDTKSRALFISTSNDNFEFRPNSTDSSSCATVTTSGITKHTSYVVTGVAYGATAGTNAEIYYNGSSEATNTTNYTSPAWGTNFYIGTSNASANPVNAIFEAIAIYSDAKSAGDVSTIKTYLNRAVAPSKFMVVV